MPVVLMVASRIPNPLVRVRVLTGMPSYLCGVTGSMANSELSEGRCRVQNGLPRFESSHEIFKFVDVV